MVKSSTQNWVKKLELTVITRGFSCMCIWSTLIMCLWVMCIWVMCLNDGLGGL